jgi:multicomponent Na+:H+ antiporter subunit G
MTVVDVCSGVLLAVGSIFVLTGGLGLLRFPDFYTRIHAVGITDPVGTGLILLGLMLRADTWNVVARLLIILLFLALTSPTATHILAHAARRDGLQAWREGEPRR